MQASQQMHAPFKSHCQSASPLCHLHSLHTTVSRRSLHSAPHLPCPVATSPTSRIDSAMQPHVPGWSLTTHRRTPRPRLSVEPAPRAGCEDDWQTQQIFHAMKLPSQAESLFNPTSSAEEFISRVPVAEATKSASDLDYLSELLAIQQSNGPKNVGFFGTRNMGVTHQKLVEILSYAYASTGNHIFTSGATGTNAAVIKGALRANAPEQLTVILPQSLKQQPAESQELLSQVADLVEMPENDHLPLIEASRICNRTIVSRVQQVICFAFHDSRLLLETCLEAKEMKKIVTLFYLD